MLMGAYKLLSPNDWRIEQFMPIFIILIPDIKNQTFEEQYSEIYKNQQTLITPFDIYYTIRDIIYGKRYKDKYKNINGCKCINNNVF